MVFGRKLVGKLDYLQNFNDYLLKCSVGKLLISCSEIIFFVVFDPVYSKCTGRTSSKMDVSRDIDPIEISRISNQQP